LLEPWYCAVTTVALKRQRSKPAVPSGIEKWLPMTVMGVPPSITPRLGQIEDINAAIRKEKVKPLCTNCCPFIESAILARSIFALTLGDTHIAYAPFDANLHVAFV
jgi:hypothetical protein